MRSPIPLYLGGFIGPFGGAVLAVLIPELRDAFGASTGEIALAVPAYLVPFSLLQLVSGTYGERLGRRRTVQVAYVVYAIASVGTALAPNLELFLAGRALQGVANAFTTPLLLAAIVDVVDRDRLGRTVGTFAGVQAGGVSLAPLLGGLVAEVSWRLAFLAPAAVSLALVFFAPAEREEGERPPATFRALATRRVALLSFCAFAGYVGFTGLPFLLSLRIDDAFAVSPTVRGLVLAGYGAAGLLFGRAGGRVVERAGARRSAIVGAVLGAVLVAPLGALGLLGATAAVWTAAGAASALLWAGLNTLAIETSEANRAGVVSVFQAFKFFGAAAAPVLWLPVYHDSASLVFLAAACVLLSSVAAIPPGLTAARDRA